MADWDPFAEDDAPGDAAPAPGSGMAINILEDTQEIEGSTTRVMKRDWEKCMETCWTRMQKDEPWIEMPDPKPDLSWHKPTCTLEAWKHQDVKCELGEGIVYFTLNTPSNGNRLTGSLVRALVDAVFLLHERKDIRVAVFSGEGKILCAGGEPQGDGGDAFEKDSQPAEVLASRQRLVEEAIKAGAFPEGCENMGRLLMSRFWHVLAAVPQFTICVANGSAIGDGLALVLCCDYAISMSGAFFSLSDMRAGWVPAAAAPFVVGKASTGVGKNLYCTAQNMNAERASDVGFVDDIVDSVEDATKLVKTMCEQITKCGPRTVAFAKELVWGVQGQQIIEPLMWYTGFMLEKVSISEEALAASTTPQGQAKPWELKPIKPLH